MDISVIVPLFNESESILELVDGIDTVMKNNNFTYEIVMIDDGSNDGSWEIIEDRAKKKKAKLKEQFPSAEVYYRKVAY